MKKKPASKAKTPQKNNKIIKSPKKKIKFHKTPSISVAERVEFIKRLRLAEYAYSDIIKINKVKRWGVKQDQIFQYIAKADKEIREYKKSDMPKWIKECEQKLKQLFLVNYSLGDFTECRRVLDTANKILGFEKLKVEIDKTETTNINIKITKEITEPARIEEVIEEAFNSKLIPQELLEKIGVSNN
jgi:hypothetical protein